MLHFNSSLSEMIKTIGKPVQAHIGSVLNFVSNGFTSCEQTQIKGISKLLPSFTLTYGKYGLDLQNHWNLEFDFNRRKKLDNLEEELNYYEQIYREGISDYLNHKNTSELGTLLSGGHDTTFALIQGGRVHNRPLHAFTATFPGWAFDESTYAKNVCKKYGHIHHEVPFLPQDLDYMVGLIRANDEPVVGSSLPVHRCAHVASQYVDTMLAGDGGDTIWGEYYPVEELHRYLGGFSQGIRHWLWRLSNTLVKMTDWERFWELEHVLSIFDCENPYHDFLRRLCTYRHYKTDELYRVFNQDFTQKLNPEIGRWTLEFNRENFGDRLIEGKLFNGFYMYQSFHTTRSMNHFGLELYLPTINRDLMRFITRLPKNWVNGGTTFHRLTNNKTINRKFHKHALARYLDREEIYNRSFDIPWYNILRPRKNLIEKLESALYKRGWFEMNEISRIFKEFLSQNVKEHELLELKHHGYRIFTLLSLEIWSREYIDGRWTSAPDEKINLEDYLS
jgi:asparagine synthase (glutamine-hydrolysing)